MRKKAEETPTVPPSVTSIPPADDFKTLEQIIIGTYESSVTIPEAERYAALFLAAQMSVADKLKALDLDSRMRKSGVKALRAETYLAEVDKHEKKPAEGYLEAVVNADNKVLAEQKGLDESEVNRDSLQTYLGIFKDAHIYFRGISKGKFD